MYDIKPLEEEWQKYRKKKRRPLYMILMVLLLLVAAGALVKYKNIPLFVMDKNETLSSSTIKASDVLIDKSITELEVKKELSALEANETAEEKPGVITTSDNNPMDPGDVFIDEEVKHKKNAILTPKRKKVKLHIEMIDAQTPAAYKEVEKRFSVSPNPDDSLFLAKAYYKKSKYRKAAHWALQTNKLNGDIEESWLIFARSKAKTGHKNEAIRVLKEYAKRSNSVAAKKLLKKLKK